MSTRTGFSRKLAPLAAAVAASLLSSASLL
jgi:hypothetical protein